ncbi:unnamed protein product [Arctogadus glacialis]
MSAREKIGSAGGTEKSGVRNHDNRERQWEPRSARSPEDSVTPRTPVAFQTGSGDRPEKPDPVCSIPTLKQRPGPRVKARARTPSERSWPSSWVNRT